MSNAFRTPLIDPLRTALSSILPRVPAGVFPVRHCRSFLRSLIQAQSAKRNNNLEDLVDLLGVLDPKVAGGGLWFRAWSSRMRKHIESCLSSQSEFLDRMEGFGSFTDPLKLTLMRKRIDKKDLDEAVGRLQRTMGAIFLSFPKIYFEPKDVKGLWFQKKRLECHTPGNWGKYEIRCDGSGKDFAAFIENKTSRSKIYEEYYKPFNANKEFAEAIICVLRERKKFAKKLGFTSWTEMQAKLNGYPSNTFSLLQDVYKVHSLKTTIARMKSGLANPSLLDEQFLLTRQVRKPLEFKKSEIFEAKKIVGKIAEYLTRVFGIEITEVKPSLLRHGWHKAVRVFKVADRGYIYLDLYRRPVAASPLAGAGPHCTVLRPSDEHVRIYMGLEPPYRSDVTFKKERNFTMDEITAIMHEFGHAIHILLRPRKAPVSQLPMDLRESVSVLMELSAFSDSFLDFVSSNKLTENDKKHIRRDDWFYLEILRNVAVCEYLHSDMFDPDTVDAAAQLRHVATEIYAQFSPIGADNIEPYFNPLAGEVANYLVDGESRVGYLVSYARARRALGKQQSDVSIRNYFAETGARFFTPVASPALESRIPIQHPLGPLPDMSFIWNRR